MAKKKASYKKYIIDVIERVVATFAEALLGFIGSAQFFGEINWGLAFSAAGLAALVSLLKCIAALKTGDAKVKTASLVD